MKRFLALARQYWRSEERWSATSLLLLLLVMLVGQTELNVRFLHQSGEITSALAAMDAARFREQLVNYGVLLAIGVPIFALFHFVRETLAMRWRRWQTRETLARYFAERAFYRLTWRQNEIDNPDQRIAEDIRAFTQQTLTFLLIFVGAVLQLGAFTRVLWNISHTLVLFLLGYAALGTLVTALGFGKTMVKLNFFQLHREADFRYHLVRVRENAESVAFYHGEGEESSQARSALERALDNFKVLLRWTVGLNFFQWSFSFTSFVLPSLIVGPQVLSGELEVGKLVQASGAFFSLLTALTLFVENFDPLSKYAAGIDRLHAFNKALDREAKPAHDDDPRGSIIRVESPSRFSLEHLTLRTPNAQRTLVSNLTLAIDDGEGLLIAGPSGCGKSSLLRAIAGLWTNGGGTIVHPPLEHMLFLPQKVYMRLGDLRSQLLYPRMDAQATDAELLALLEQVHLGNLAERVGGLHADLDFAKVLSLGEQQRLAVARVLLHKPRFAILDEATSALDGDNEEHLYRLLRGSQTTLISVSHHQRVLRYHARVLVLDGRGGWRAVPAHRYSFPEQPSFNAVVAR